VTERQHMTEWQPIETAPTGEDDFYLVCGVWDQRSPFVVRGSILATARKANTPSHLEMRYLTHWMPLPPKPLEPAGARMEYNGGDTPPI
jgi:hypothetical protein